MSHAAIRHPYRFTGLKVLLLALLALVWLLQTAPARAAEDDTYDQESVLQAAVEFFGQTTEGLAKVIEKA
ncbi:MAG: hypothetical protein MUC79_15690, partial [Thiobacillaceae bacterium]|nr:hypothetical protein [Thiobacillaceae bacterium]